MITYSTTNPIDASTLRRRFHLWFAQGRGDDNTSTSLSYQTIHRAAKNYMADPHYQHLLEDSNRSSNVLNLLFYPLLRSGVVQFVGDERYQLSPSTQLLLPRGHLLIVNDFGKDVNCLPDYPGLSLYKNATHNRGGIPFDPAKYLDKIGSLRKKLEFVCEKWSQTTQVQTNWQQRLDKWEPVSSNKGSEVRLYRAVDRGGSRRYVSLDGGRLCYEIPSHMINPQAYALASLVEELSRENHDPLEISCKHDTGDIHNYIRIKNPYMPFPWELEKLLLLESIVAHDGVPLPDALQRKYAIGDNTLDHIFTLFYK